MKKIALIFLVSATLLGCAFLKDQKANFEACMDDPECKAQAESWQSKAETAAVAVASAVPVPGAAAAPKVVGYLALGIAALIGGRALRKKTEE